MGQIIETDKEIRINVDCKNKDDCCNLSIIDNDWIRVEINGHKIRIIRK